VTLELGFSEILPSKVAFLRALVEVLSKNPGPFATTLTSVSAEIKNTAFAGWEQNGVIARELVAIPAGTPIDELFADLAKSPQVKRLRNCLAHDGIRTIESLVAKTADDLLEVRNFGISSLILLREILNREGYHLAGEICHDKVERQ